MQDGEFITYSGNCDIIRIASNFQWAELISDELIVGKKYEVITSWCAQTVWIKDESGNIVKDNSGNRYLYYKIKNEQGIEIYVWEGFFEENSNL